MGAHSSPVALAMIALFSLACQRPATATSTPQEFRRAVGGVEWSLTELGGQSAPVGAGGRRATIRFDAESARAGGFAGCNRWSGGYTVEGGALRFGAIIMTKMACADGMELERKLAEALDATRRYELTSDRLSLSGDGGNLATFERDR